MIMEPAVTSLSGRDELACVMFVQAVGMLFCLPPDGRDVIHNRTLHICDVQYYRPHLSAQNRLARRLYCVQYLRCPVGFGLSGSVFACVSTYVWGEGVL
jgi:hypothetical protein